jgi:hypothetical protein
MKCERCDFTSEFDYGFTDVEGELLCSECFHEEYFYCDVCGETFVKSDMSEEKDVCRYCIER